MMLLHASSKTQQAIDVLVAVAATTLNSWHHQLIPAMTVVQNI